MITAQKAKDMRRAQNTKPYFDREPLRSHPSGLVYQGDFVSLYCTGGTQFTANYYIQISAGFIPYLLTGKRFEMSLAQGLAICKAFDLLEIREFESLCTSAPSKGMLSDYVKGVALWLRNQHGGEKELIAAVIGRYEKDLTI